MAFAKFKASLRTKVEPHKSLDDSDFVESENMHSIDYTIIPDEEGHAIPG